MVDVLGILTGVSDISSIKMQRAPATEIQKRSLTIEDDSGHSIEVTLWGEKAVQAQSYQPGTAIAFKGVKVSDYGGRALSTVTSSTIDLSPDVEDAHVLVGWYSQGNVPPAIPLSGNKGTYSGGAGDGGNRGDVRRVIADIKDISADTTDPIYSQVKATITYIRDSNLFYNACPNEACKNKKAEQDGNVYTCHSCNKSYNEANPRYIMSIAVSDHTGNCWLSCFNDVGKIIFDKDAKEVQQAFLANRNEFADIVQEATFKTYFFKIRSKTEIYQNEPKLKHTVTGVTPVNFAAETAYLQNEINRLSLGN